LVFLKNFLRLLPGCVILFPMDNLRFFMVGIAQCLFFLAALSGCNTNTALRGGMPEPYKLPKKQSVSLPNGETYAYLEQGANTGAETFLLLHGNMASSVHFLPLFSRLSSLHLLAPDMRGFGDSSYQARFSSLAELAADVKLFAEALGITKAHIVGWSTGGGVAFELAARYPEFVSSLFIIEGLSYKGYPLGVTPFASKEDMTASPVVAIPLAAFKAKDAAYFDQAWNLTIYTVNKPGSQENRLYLAETLKQRNLADLDWALVTFNMSGEDNGYGLGSGTIGNIACPLTFTSGDKDLLVSPAKIKENATIIAGSRLLEYQKCGHSPMVDCPDRLAADILEHCSN
jgi:pimeloyl-ACP methyl ester carboxylesterase